MARDKSLHGENTWWAVGSASDDQEEGPVYPPDLLGTSWGSYLHSLPATARAVHGCRPGRQVTVATLVERENKLVDHDGSKSNHSLEESPKHPALQNTAQGAGYVQPRPSFQRLSAALQRAAESLASCGVESSPLTRASETVARLQKGQQRNQESAEDCVDVVLGALVTQVKMIEEYAMSLKHTAAVLAKSQQQLARDQLEIQEQMEAAFSHIMAQKKSIAKKTDWSRTDKSQHKTYKLGLREGQHRIALMQVRKEHSRLEKALLQQQRDLQRLELAYKTMKGELAAEQHRSEQQLKKIAKSDISSRPLKYKGVSALRNKFQEHNQQLGHLVHRLEASTQELLETEHCLRARERGAHITTAVSCSTHTHNHSLPPIISRAPLRKETHFISSSKFSLPKVSKNQHQRQEESCRKLGQILHSELMDLANFRSYEAAKAVFSWLEREKILSER